jgi:murein DD-endopeptidase MepM/ murein hydrolase activator NlpD
MALAIMLSLLVAVVGLLVYALADGKVSQAGLYAWAVGLLAFLLRIGDHVIKL